MAVQKEIPKEQLKAVDLSQYGLKEPVILRSVPYKIYKEYSKRVRAAGDGDTDAASTYLLREAIVSAPFPHATEDELEDQPLEVILELTFAVKEMVSPLLDRMQKQTSTASDKPTRMAREIQS